MSLRKFLNLFFMLLLALAIACGEGKQVVEEEELGDDDHAPTTAASGETSGGTAATAAPAVVADAATLAGTVKFEGGAPKMPTLQMGADPFCQSQHSTPVPDEEVVLGPAGELANVLVYVENAPTSAAPSTPALLDQKGCQYYPHVSAVQVGQSVQIKNSDSTLHNVHAMPVVNSQFNEGQPLKDMVSTKKFDKVELKPFRIKCDVHGWMKSYMAVLPHGYHAVSQTNGTFSIGNLPPGNYNVVAWHEKYGEQKQPVTVGPKETKQIAFTFKG